jgi:signal transduction histidine kinase
MDGDFIRNRLFRPFDSTKGERGMGIGAYQAREFARCCGGDVTVESAPQRGTRFTFSLPTTATSTTAATITTTTCYELKAS